VRLSCHHLGLLLALFAFSGCTSPNSSSNSAARAKTGRFMVAVNKSPFYKYGPAQAFGADFALNRGQQLTLVQRSFGFSKVMTDDGQSGYMPTEDLVPAPFVPPPATPPVLAARRKSGSSAGSGRLYSGPVRKSAPPQKLEGATPLFDVFDVPLPSNPEPANPAEPAPAKPPSPE
jgi:hypothetical protein